MKVFLDAYFANNFGDDLMIKGLIDKYPTFEFYAISSNIDAMESYRNHSNIRFIKKFNKKIKYDYYVFLGGSIYQFIKNKNIKNHLSRIKRMIISRKKGSKIVTIGSNIGPLEVAIGKKIIPLELRMQELITVRDEMSYEFLLENKIKGEKYLIQDIAFELLNNYNINKATQENILGISSFKLSQDYIKTISEVAKEHLSKNKNNKIWIFSFNPKTENDNLFAEKIKKTMPVSLHHNIKLINYEGNTHAFLGKLSECSSFIAVRFHSLIISYMFGIPFIPIIYSNKTENFLNDINYSGKRFYSYVESHSLEKDMIDSYNNISNVEYTDSKTYLGESPSKHFDKLDQFILKTK